MKKMLMAAIMALCVMATGCMSIGRYVTDADIAKFKSGVSTKAQIIDALGRPSADETIDGKYAMMYKWEQATPVAGLGEAYKRVTFHFDEHGILERVHVARKNTVDRETRP